ncbi:MATE family efflux transporter [Sediminibacterium ginsengisoli]|uniref:Multidrug-efflux transporter n=1 Tax=Sediminibacterium ginsengisoli TaxID=413434 RepID=A0A1T4MFI4_9BACT|nr:MATE family efflux transporter [Sediminibacterium ginsengisoli]SJZ65830.1 putative efflux protein, MATE family [Sediminibacterium ginsengisoli]
MNTNSNQPKQGLLSYIKESLNSEHQDFTQGSIRKAIFLLAVPMILEMCMESVFAVVDIFFVGKLGPNAAATVGLTESFLTLIYSVAIGLSMAATATVARRVGEKNPEGAAKAGAQAIMIAVTFSILISVAGLFFADAILRLMGANAEIIAMGTSYARIMLAGNIVIMLLFLINGIFRGAGDAAIAMRSLWLANICNIILCPLLIHFFGLPGAAIATTIGRGIGVCYQLYRLFKGKGVISIQLHHFKPDPAILKSLLSIASTGTLQFIVGSASWIAMARIITGFGSDAIAGYTIAIRLLIFFIMPAWGLSNAAATLVGQNLGAGLPERAEQSVWKTARYNAIFMAAVSLLFIVGAEFFVGLINSDPAVMKTGVAALRTVSMGYIFYGVGMVMINAFNGAGDSRTPTWINLFWFWIFQIPFAYLLASVWKLGPQGVFLAIVITETCIAVTSVIIFRKGKWKTVKI